MTIDELKNRIKEFSILEYNWDGYQGDVVTEKSIKTDLKVLTKLIEEPDIYIYVYPMTNGGIQFELGDLKEVEIIDNDVRTIIYDSDFNIIEEKQWDINKEYRLEKLKRL